VEEPLALEGQILSLRQFAKGAEVRLFLGRTEAIRGSISSGVPCCCAGLWAPPSGRVRAHGLDPLRRDYP
jgi:hypothetical protein